MGFAVFTSGSLLAIAGFVLIALGYWTDGRAALIVALVAAGHALSLAGVAFLRDDRYQRLAAEGKAIEAAGLRYRLGVTLLVLHLAVYLCVWTVGVLSYTRATLDDPRPSVLGLSFEQQGPAFVGGVVLAELLFVATVYALGPEWWQRFKQLFRYEPARLPPADEAPAPAPTLRYRAGLALFVLGNVLAVSGLVLPALGFAKGRMVGVIAVLLGAGEVVSLSSIFFLGKEGFKRLKSRLLGVLKRTAPGYAISIRRHRVGCTLIALHVVLQFMAIAFPIASHYGVATEGAFPEVLGLGRDQQLAWFVGLLGAAELLFFAGVYALGPDWWARFRALFTPPTINPPK